jgi:hypothetical protein
MRVGIYQGHTVEFEVITSFPFDPILAQRYILLADGTTHDQPKVHGYQPQTGDYFVHEIDAWTGSDRRSWAEPGEAIILNQAIARRDITIPMLSPESDACSTPANPKKLDYAALLTLIKTGTANGVFVDLTEDERAQLLAPLNPSSLTPLRPVGPAVEEITATGSIENLKEGE